MAGICGCGMQGRGLVAKELEGKLDLFGLIDMIFIFNYISV